MDQSEEHTICIIGIWVHKFLQSKQIICLLDGCVRSAMPLSNLLVCHNCGK